MMVESGVVERKDGPRESALKGFRPGQGSAWLTFGSYTYYTAIFQCLLGC